MLCIHKKYTPCLNSARHMPYKMPKIVSKISRKILYYVPTLPDSGGLLPVGALLPAICSYLRCATASLTIIKNVDRHRVRSAASASWSWSSNKGRACAILSTKVYMATTQALHKLWVRSSLPTHRFHSNDPVVDYVPTLGIRVEIWAC